MSKTIIGLKPFYSIADGAALLGLSYNKFYDLVRAGAFGDPDQFRIKGRKRNMWRIPITALVPDVRFEVQA